MSFVIRKSTLINYFLLLTFIGAPLTWVPVIPFSGSTFEIPNAISLACIALLPIVALRSIPRDYLPYLLVLWLFFYFSSMALNNTPEGYLVARKYVGSLALFWVVAILIQKTPYPIHRLGMAGVLGLLIVMELSFILTGSDFFLALLDYVTSFNRNEFTYHKMRPAFNAFVPQSGDLTYVASQINTVANFAILFGLFACIDQNDAKRRLIFWPISVICFVIFSSSAVLTLVVYFVLSFVFQKRQLSTFQALGMIVLTAAVGILITSVSAQLAELAGSNITADERSRGARISQYVFALQAINQSPFIGLGYFEVDGYPVHNWLAFSWSNAGFLPAVIVVWIYAIAFMMAYRLAAAHPRNAAIYLTVFFMFLLRTSVGGAGGIPAGPALFALTFLYSEYLRHSQSIQ